jgi:hypothetical protein
MTNGADSRELRLVRAIIRGQRESAGSISGAPDFNWRALLDYADAQTVAASLFHAAQSHALMPLLPHDVLESLRKSFLSQYRWNSLLLARAAELEATFRRHGREVIFLKGLRLAHEFYGQFAARQVGDIDVLIKDPLAVGEFEEMLRGLGYRRRSRILGSRALMSRFTHHVEFDGPFVPLDLHWVLRRHPSFALDYSAIWKERQLVEVRKVRFFALPIEYEMALQFLSIQNDVQLGVVRLKSFIDLYAILKRVASTLDCAPFLARRAEEGLLRMSINVLDLALEVLDCRDEFPALAESIARHRSKLVLADAAAKMDLFRGTGDALKRRMWALRLYETSAIRAFYWWGLSLPFRLAEHRQK